MKKFAMLLFVVLIASVAHSQQVPPYIESPDDADGIFMIYPDDGVPPGSEKWTWHERTIKFGAKGDMVFNVVIPTITMFSPPKGKANGTAVVVAPGGAFHFLAIDSEGYDIARWLNELGITAFVLKYRIMHAPDNNSEIPAYIRNVWGWLKKGQPKIGNNADIMHVRMLGIEDGRQAVRYLRQNAAKFNINPNHIGVLGFSAGGSVVTNISLQYDNMSYPDFAGAIYPGPRFIKKIPEKLPPIFIAIGGDDKIAKQDMVAKLYEIWHKSGNSAELHIFANGNHGFSVKKQGKLTDQWTALFENWMRAEGFIPKDR